MGKFYLNNKIAFALPKQKEKAVFTHTENRETYFYADVNVNAFSKEKTMPKKIAIAWDTSLSSSKRNTKRELLLLDAYFKRFPDIEVSLVTFNIKIDINKKFLVKGGAWDTLKKEIDSLVYDGATRFNELNFDNLKVDEILLFSDGISTFGNTRIKASKTPVFIINSSTEFERGMLRAAARDSGGAFINLNGLTDEKALTMITGQNLRLVNYSFNKNSFREIYPLEGAEISENFTFAGILTSPEAEITLSFGYGKNDIREKKTIKINSGGDNPAVSRLWAQQKIKELEFDSENNEEEILKLGKEFSVVTEFTSLLVLEELRDYITYKILPPKELLSEYYETLADIKEEEEEERADTLEDAIEQAEEIKEWWKKNFDQSKPSKEFEKLRQADSDTGSQYVAPSSILSQSAAPAPPAPAAPTEDIDTFAGVPESIMNITGDGIAINSNSGSYSDLEERPLNASVKMVSSPVDAEMGRSAGKTQILELLNVMGGVDSAETNITGDEEIVNIELKAWDPQTPYMKILQKSKDGELYEDYLKLKYGYEDQPSFYFDVTDEFVNRGQNGKALIVLSNIAEMKLDNIELLLTAANKLMELGEHQYAVDLFEKILKLRGEDPQSYRNLALAYQAVGENQKALELFYKALTGNWRRFEEIKQIVFVEMNNLISLNPGLKLSGINKKLIFNMPVNVRIVLGWSTDNTDIDIHVRDPYGETAFYRNRLTRIGGRVSEVIHDPRVANTLRNRVTLRQDCAQNIFGAKVDFT